MPTIEHINVKLFAVSDHIEWHHLIPVFHRWIQAGKFADVLPFDVADYAHVPAGPGVMLIGHHATISVDNRENRPGLLYNRRTAMPGSTEDKLRHAYEGALAAARQLESEPEFKGALRFDEGHIEVFVNDRLLAPNNEQTWSTLQATFAAVWGHSARFDWKRDPRGLFRVEIGRARVAQV